MCRPNQLDLLVDLVGVSDSVHLWAKRSPLGNVRTPKVIKFSNRSNPTSSVSNMGLCRPSQRDLLEDLVCVSDLVSFWAKRSPLVNVRTPKDIKFSIRNTPTSRNSNIASRQSNSVVGWLCDSMCAFVLWVFVCGCVYVSQEASCCIQCLDYVKKHVFLITAMIYVLIL